MGDRGEPLDFKQLADLVGDGVLKEAIDVNSTQITRFQQLKEEHLGINSNLDFFKHYEFLLKELDPTKNGFVTDQELEDIFKLVYPTALRGKNLKRAFKTFASIQNKLLIDYKRVQQALQQSVARRKGARGADMQGLDTLAAIATKEDRRRERLHASKGVE